MRRPLAEFWFWPRPPWPLVAYGEVSLSSSQQLLKLGDPIGYLAAVDFADLVADKSLNTLAQNLPFGLERLELFTRRCEVSSEAGQA